MRYEEERKRGELCGNARCGMWVRNVVVAGYCCKQRGALSELIPKDCADYFPLSEDQDQDPNGIDQHSPGAKLDAGKIQAGLLCGFPRALLAVAEVSTYGAKKYSRDGWKSVPDAINRYRDAGWRHRLAAVIEERDPGSGLLHKAHEAWNILAELEKLLEGG